VASPSEHPHAPSRERRLLRWAPWLVAIILALLTTSARQWEMLAGALPRTSGWGAYRFAPSGNEWRLRRATAFGADRFELRRTFTVNDEIDPPADALAAFRGMHLPEGVRIDRITMLYGRQALWQSVSWGWPMRHTSVDTLGRRHILPLGFTVDSLLATPIWWLILHAIRKPISAVFRYFRRPAWECRSCRYDLRGIPDDAPCPECGRERIAPPPA
jgi:hypothetical protein